MLRTTPQRPPRSEVGRSAAYAFMIACAVCMAAIFLCRSGNVMAQEMHHHGADQGDMGGMRMSVSPAPVFIASTGKSFAALMEDAMAVMDEGMANASVNGQSAHDFVTMMLPHHQGAVDMARAMLLYTDDPEIRNLALGIITEQQTEIRVMQLWLQRHDQAAIK